MQSAAGRGDCEGSLEGRKCQATTPLCHGRHAEFQGPGSGLGEGECAFAPDLPTMRGMCPSVSHSRAWPGKQQCVRYGHSLALLTTRKRLAMLKVQPYRHGMGLVARARVLVVRARRTRPGKTPHSADKLQRTLLVRMSSSTSLRSEVNAASLMSWERDMSVGAHAPICGHLAMWTRCALTLPTHWVMDMFSLFDSASFALCALVAWAGLWPQRPCSLSHKHCPSSH